MENERGFFCKRFFSDEFRGPFRLDQNSDWLNSCIFGTKHPLSQSDFHGSLNPSKPLPVQSQPQKH